jgi:hypothetical protein
LRLAGNDAAGQGTRVISGRGHGDRLSGRERSLFPASSDLLSLAIVL